MYKLLKVDSYADERGLLYVLENGTPLPIVISRCFWIKNVPSDQIRGAHAHRTCGEIIVAACGSFEVKVTNGACTETIILDNSEKALYIPPYTWCELQNFSAGALCLCLAEGSYQVDGYINNYEEYVEIMSMRKKNNRIAI